MLQLQQRAAPFLLVAALSACSTIDPHNRVEGWPELRVTEYRVSLDEVQERCRPYVSFGQWPMACAVFYLRAAQCHIFYAYEWTLEHERQHCAGYDHVGSNHMREMLGRAR